MNLTAYRDEIKFRLTGGVLDIELDDVSIDKAIQASLRELQRYICTTDVITLPYASCMKLSDYKLPNGKPLKVSAVTNVFRSKGFVPDNAEGTQAVDPMYATQWQILSGTGNMYNFQDYMYNYGAWNTLLQIRNTGSTDLSFYYNKPTDELYINVATSVPSTITSEYITRYDSVEEITSDYWSDILLRLSVAVVKVTLGRIRSRYTQSNALWTQDGETMLNEGTQELTDLRAFLQTNSQLGYPID